MKTIEQAAKEFIVGTSDNQDERDIAENAFKAGVEWAQKWIDAKKEKMPEDILIMMKDIQGRQFIDYYRGLIKKRVKVTHWRQIEFK